MADIPCVMLATNEYVACQNTVRNRASEKIDRYFADRRLSEVLLLSCTTTTQRHIDPDRVCTHKDQSTITLNTGT